MIAGLRLWRDTASARDHVIDSLDHEGWRVEQRVAGLGVVGFVFEGRPNVFADACGVLRSGNTVVFRIGSDALGTARAIVEPRPRPGPGGRRASRRVGGLIDSPAHAAGWALFSDPTLALAVAAAAARPSPSSVRWLARVAPRSACTAPAGPGSSPGPSCDPNGSRRWWRPRSIARSATPSTPAVSCARRPTSWCPAS